MRFSLIAILFFIISLNVNAASLELDESNDCLFSQEKLEDFRADGSFFYLEAEENEADLYDAYNNILVRILRAIFGNRAASYVFSNFHYIILGFALLILILYFRKIHLNGVRSRKRSTQQNSSIDIEAKEIKEIDFDSLIKEALKHSNFKLAIRYHYLNMLKQMNLKGIIKWESHKTNFDYFLEIKDENTKNNYRRLSVIFEYIWYGESDINEMEYNEISQGFKELKVVN